MKFWLTSDTHLKHQKVATYCRRPENFTELIDQNMHKMLKPEDTLIHLGDVGIDKAEGPDGFMKYVRAWPGRKILVRGNHDNKSCGYYMEHGFSFACDAMVFRGCWLTHKPWLGELPEGTHLNLHGHLHNVWDGFLPEDPEKEQDEFVTAAKTGKLMRPWQRLFAVEYTNYMPVDFDKFVAKPDKYQARGPNEEGKKRILEEQRKIQEKVNAKLDEMSEFMRSRSCPLCASPLGFCPQGEYCTSKTCRYVL